MKELKIEMNLPPELEKYITEFMKRTDFIIFGLGNKLFELTELHEHSSMQRYELLIDKAPHPYILVEPEEVFEVIKDAINEKS